MRVLSGLGLFGGLKGAAPAAHRDAARGPRGIGSPGPVHDEGRIRVRPDVSQVQALLAAIGKVVPADLQHALVSVDVEPGRDHMGASLCYRRWPRRVRPLPTAQPIRAQPGAHHRYRDRFRAMPRPRGKDLRLWLDLKTRCTVGGMMRRSDAHCPGAEADRHSDRGSAGAGMAYLSLGTGPPRSGGRMDE